RALERHEQGEARVIPVVLHPCAWQGTLFGKLMAVPTDGRPISKFPNQHDAFLEVTNAIRKVAEELRPRSEPSRPRKRESFSSPQPTPVTPQVRSSNLRIKKRFSDHDKDQFLDDTFEYMANFFEESLA